jgi:hypothetical protein
VRDGGLGEQLERDVVVDRAVGADDAAVAVRGVGAEADVGDHDQLGVGLLDRPHGELDDALVVVGAGARLVLLGGDAEQQHRRDAELLDRAGLLDRVRDRQPLDAGHRLDRRAAVGAELDEQRLDEVCRRELGLAHHVAQQAATAQPAHAGGWKCHRDQSRPPAQTAPR